MNTATVGAAAAGSATAAVARVRGAGDLGELLKSNPNFSDLSAEELNFVLSGAEVATMRLGQIVLRKGDTGSGFFLLLKGRVRVIDDTDRHSPATLARLTKGAGFGERSLLFGEAVSATIRCSSSVVLLRLSPAHFAEVVARFPSVRQRMETAARRQIEFNFLRVNELFAGADNRLIDALLDTLATRDLVDGEILANEGDPADRLHIVRSGRLRFSVGSGTLLGFGRPGALVGAGAILGAAHEGMTITAEGPTRVLSISAERFAAHCRPNAALWRQLEEWAATRRLQSETILAAAGQPDEDAEESALDQLLHHDWAVSRRGWRRVRYPVVLAARRDLHGPACMAMAARHFRVPIDLGPLSAGSSLRADPLIVVARQAEAHGLLTRYVRLGADDLRRVALPAVASLRGGGLAFVWWVDKDRIGLVNPDTGFAEMPLDDFVQEWDGHLLTIAYVPDFGSDGGLVARFLPLLRPHRRTFLNVIVLTLLLLCLAALTPLFSRTLVDQVVLFDDWPLLWLLLSCVLVAAVMEIAGGLVRELLTMYATAAIGTTLQVRFLAHILLCPIDQIGRWKVADLMLRFDENDQVLRVLSRRGVELLVDGAAVLIFGALLLLTSPALGLLSLLFAAAMAGLLVYAAPRLRRLENLIFLRQADLQAHLIELVDGIATIKSLSREASFAAKGAALLDENIVTGYRAARMRIWLGLALEGLKVAAGLMVMWAGARMVLGGELSAGSLVAFSGLLVVLLNAVESLSRIYDDVLRVRVGMSRVDEVLRIAREPSLPAALCPPIRGEVRFDEVAFSYTPDAGAWTVAPLSLTIPAGSKVGLVGPSGSGKTTLVKLVNRLIEPTHGKIFIDGIDISQVDVESLRRQIGVVEQSPCIFAGTIRDNIAMADPRLPQERVTRAAKLAGISELVDRLPMGYDTRIGEGGRVLSGGQSQRIVIARALATDPPLLIFDEATAALDTETERIIQANLDAVMQGRTTFVIAHRLSTIRNADVILVMDQGHIVESGTHDVLMARQGTYWRLATAVADVA